MIGKILVVLLGLFNLGLAAWSGAAWNWDFEPWLKAFPIALPLLAVGAGCLAKSILVVNLGIPALLFFARALLAGHGSQVDLLLHDLCLGVVAADIIYMASVTLRYRYWKEFFYGLGGGLLILFAYHKVLFGGISLKGNLMKLYENSVDWVDKKVK